MGTNKSVVPESSSTYFEPADDELQRRAEALGSCQRHPLPPWERFRRFLEHEPQNSLNTSILSRWLGSRVVVSRLDVSNFSGPRSNTMQLRETTLSVNIRDQQIPVCRAQSRVCLHLLPPWAIRTLTTTRFPLGRILRRAGAIRNRSVLHVIDPQPNRLDEHGALVSGIFCLRSDQSVVVAEVREYFTLNVLTQSTEVDLSRGDDIDRRLDDIDQAYVQAVRERIALASRYSEFRQQGAPPAYAIHDEMLRSQLVDEVGRQGATALVEPIRRSNRRRPNAGASNERQR